MSDSSRRHCSYSGWQLAAFRVIFLPLCGVPITSVPLAVYKPPNCFCSGYIGANAVLAVEGVNDCLKKKKKLWSGVEESPRD